MAEDDKSKPKPLPIAVRRFIVEELACYEPTKEVIKAVRERFGEDGREKQPGQERGLVIDGQTVRSHDPTKARGVNLSKTLKEHFYEVRKLFDEESRKKTIGNIDYRLSMRRVMVERARARGDDRFAAQLLNEAAQDVGGKFTNQKVHSGPGGGPIEVAVEDRRKALAAALMVKRLAKGMSYSEAKAELIGLGVNERDIPDISGE